MAFTKEDLKKLGLDDEQINGVMAERGKEIEAEKKKLKDVQNKLDAKTETLEKVNKDFEELKKKELTNEEFKTKFENLQKEVKEKEEKAEAERKAKVKAEAISKRFDTVAGDKKWSHEAIKADYLKKFSTAVDDEGNLGKSDSDIFLDLVKDDSTAFVGVQQKAVLKGAESGAGKTMKKEDILAIKDGAKRREAMAEALKSDPNFFN